MNTQALNLKSFLDDDKQDNLLVYEVEIDKIEDPNEQLWAYAKAQGECPCRLWLVLFSANLIIVIITFFLILLLLMEIGPTPPYQNYGEQCVSSICDMNKGLVCSNNGKSKNCRCPDGNWFWHNEEKCRECPPNWIVGNNGKGCFFVTHTQLNFTDANFWCHSSQGRLLEISQNDLFVALQSSSQFGFRVNDFYWIGLRETGPNLNTYRWVTSGSNFPSSNYFCSGQPAHSYNFYFQQYDQCVGLTIQSNFSSCLSDFTCPNVARFICELY